MANNNNNTIVVIHSVSAVEMPWLDHPNIKAIVWAGKKKYGIMFQSFFSIFSLFL